MPRRNNDAFAREWIQQLEMRINNNESNMAHSGTGARAGFSQLASATGMLRVQLASWQESFPQAAKRKPVVHRPVATAKPAVAKTAVPMMRAQKKGAAPAGSPKLKP